MCLNVLFNSFFWFFALVISFFYGYYAIKIFISEEAHKTTNGVKFFHQLWFNFFGSIAGWSALYILIVDIIFGTRSLHALFDSPKDYFLAFIAFIGVTGNLPYAVMGFLEAPKSLVLAGTDWLKAVLEKQLKN